MDKLMIKQMKHPNRKLVSYKQVTITNNIWQRSKYKNKFIYYKEASFVDSRVYAKQNTTETELFFTTKFALTLFYRIHQERDDKIR